jgi:hypothetical protein
MSFVEKNDLDSSGMDINDLEHARKEIKKQNKKAEKANAKLPDGSKKKAKIVAVVPKRPRRGCCHISKNGRCFMFAGIVVAGAVGSYLGGIESGDPEEAPVVVTPGTGGTVVAGMFGYTVGPLMLVYGYKIREFVVVLNSLISNGIDSFVDSITYMETLNAQASGGRLMPDQIASLLSILLSAFTLSTAALKVKKLRASMKGGVIANLFFGTVVDQIPGMYGCICEDYELGEVPCTPAVNWALYESTPSCLHDKWVRFYMNYTAMLIMGWVGTQAQKVVDKLNSSMVAGNLINEAIYDTALAALPQWSTRVQPFRMCSLGLFTLIGFYTQLVLFAMDMSSDASHVDTYCLCIFLWLHRIEKYIIAPLLFLNSWAKQLAVLGNADLQKDLAKAKGGGAAGGGAMPPMSIGAMKSKLRGKIPSLLQFTLLYQVFINPVTSRIVLFVLNLVLMIFACLMVIMGCGIAVSEYNIFFNKNIIICFIVAGVFMFFLSLLGFGGGYSKNLKWLLPYTILLFIIISMELAAMVHVYQNYSLDDRDLAIAFVKGQTETFYQQGNCNTTSLNPPPFNITCYEEKFKSFELFVNNGCVFRGEEDLVEVKAKAVQSMLDGDYDSLKFYGAELNLIEGTKDRIIGCLGQYNTTISDPTGSGIYCVCANVLMSQVDQMKNLAYVCLAVALMQLVVFLMALRLLGIDVSAIVGDGNSGGMAQRSQAKMIV